MMHETKKMQIYDLLKKRIKSGYYPPGSRLPKEVDLAAELKVARITLRPALELLEIEKLVSRIKGRGTFIHDRSTPKTKLMILFTNIHDISNPFIYIIPCMQAAAERMNVHLELCGALSLLSAAPDQCAEQILAKGFQGIFWMANGFTGKEPLLETVRKTGLPVLLPHAFKSDAEITGFSAMGTNYEELTRDGLKYLAATGHRRVGYIGDSRMRNISRSDYLKWVREAGLDPDPELLRLDKCRKDKQKVLNAVAGLMTLPDTPTAIFSYSDYFSLQIYEYLHRQKIRIPEEVSVLSIGGQIGCDFLDPPLSALEYGNQEIADGAIRVMLEMLRDHRKVKWTVTPHRLAVRESTRRILFHHPQNNHCK